MSRNVNRQVQVVAKIVVSYVLLSRDDVYKAHKARFTTVSGVLMVTLQPFSKCQSSSTVDIGDRCAFHDPPSRSEHNQTFKGDDRRRTVILLKENTNDIEP